MTKSTLYDPEFDFNSKSVFETMLDARNRKLQLPIETAGQASQLDIPTRPDRTEPIFELTIPNMYPGHYPTERTNPNG